MMGLCNRLRRLFSRYNNYYKAKFKGFLGMSLSIEDILALYFSPKMLRSFDYDSEDRILPMDENPNFHGTLKIPKKKDS